jgi:hypothetical protein
MAGREIGRKYGRNPENAGEWTAYPNLPPIPPTIQSIYLFHVCIYIHLRCSVNSKTPLYPLKFINLITLARHERFQFPDFRSKPHRNLDVELEKQFAEVFPSNLTRRMVESCELFAEKVVCMSSINLENVENSHVLSVMISLSTHTHSRRESYFYRTF